MRGINTYTLSFLTFAALAKACAYGDMLGEPGENQDYRYCRVGVRPLECQTMKLLTYSVVLVT